MANKNELFKLVLLILKLDASNDSSMYIQLSFEAY